MNPDLLERYNTQLHGLEDTTIRMLNRVLDYSFNRLIRRVRAHMHLGPNLTADRNLAILQELRQLIPAARPDKVDSYDRLLRNLLGPAQNLGLTTADYLTANMDPTRARINVSIPLDATIAAVQEARGYLTKHGRRFAETSAEVVAKGILEGRPTDLMVKEMRDRLAVTKARASTVVRTESLRAYNRASDSYYVANNIQHVAYYATSDDRTCPICAPRAGRIYKRGEVRVPLHPNCVLGDTLITPGTIIAATRALYRGDLITITTRNGRQLTVTAKHPILTLRGWVRAVDVQQELDSVCCTLGVPITASGVPDLNNDPTSASNIFETLRTAQGVTTCTMPTAPMDFHGDGECCEGDIEVIFTQGPLVNERGAQALSKLAGQFRNTELLLEPRLSPTDALLLGMNATTNGLMGMASQCQAFLVGQLSVADEHRLATAARRDTRLLEPLLESGPADTETLRRRLETFTPLVVPDQIVHIERFSATAHPISVYDFTTQSSTYSANNLVVHNCRCYVAPWDIDLDRIDPDYKGARTRHRREVGAARRSPLSDDLQKALFEAQTPTPVE